jgi:hypothetical protein
MRVESLLEVDKQFELPFSLAKYLLRGDWHRWQRTSRPEVSLVCFRYDEMRELPLDPLLNCFLLDLGDEGSHYYCPDLVQSTRTLSEDL